MILSKPSHHFLAALASGTPWQLAQMLLDIQLHDSLNNAYNGGTDHLLKFFVLEDCQN